MLRRMASCFGLLLMAVQVSQATGAGDSGAAAGWVVEARLTPEKLGSILKDGFSLPQLRVYDRDGRLLHDFGGGFDPETFEAELERLVKSPKASPETPVGLPGELEGMIGSDGKPLDNLTPIDLTFVEYWAEWCVPCHMQFDALTKFKSSRPQVHARLLHTETDPEKMGAEVQVEH